MSGSRRGSMSIQLAVIMVPVLFAFMGFAIDLGRVYLIRGELHHATSAMAFAAASQLIGTSGALEAATAAAQLSLDDGTGRGNKYNFGALVIGESTALLSSEVLPPAFFSTAASATGDSTSSGADADGTTARHVSIDVRADAPLLFTSLFAVGRSPFTPVTARSVAGISAPLCTACGIEPFAVAALSMDETTDFGFIPGTKYTLGFNCTVMLPTPVPAPLPGTTQRIPYLLLVQDRLDDSGALDENQQLFKMGAQGLLPSTTSSRACITIGAGEVVWAGSAPTSCAAQAPTTVRAAACGIYTRLESAAPAACATIADIETLVSAYQPDTDIASIDDYTAYTGNTRRVITVPVVDALRPVDAMTVLGFRQFLVEPNQNDSVTNPADQNARFVAMYIGSVVPVKQGRFDGGCQVSAGPGKVVLHQ